MMNYNNGLSFMPSYMNPQQQMSNLINQYPQYFNPALQQAVANQTTQPSQQQTQQNNSITTQPPIMQPQSNIRNDAKMLYVGNKEEATATPIDLVYNTPTFFFNRGANQVYMKQYDSTTGNAIFKTFVEEVESKYDYGMAVNQLYADYSNIFTEPSYYMKMARNYLTSKNYPYRPQERAYHEAEMRSRGYDYRDNAYGRDSYNNYNYNYRNHYDPYDYRSERGRREGRDGRADRDRDGKYNE